MIQACILAAGICVYAGTISAIYADVRGVGTAVRALGVLCSAGLIAEIVAIVVQRAGA